MAPVFDYSATNREGDRIKGSLEMEDANQLVKQLRGKGYFVTAVEEKKRQRGIQEYLLMSRKVKINDLTIFSQQFSAMIDAGINLVDSLEIIQEQIEHPKLQKAVRKVREDVETGSSLSEALARHPTVFPDLYCQLVKAGESGGVLDKVLNQLALHYEKQDEINRKIKSALYYPLTILLVAVVVVIFLLINVIPQFVSMFISFGGILPLPTRILLSASGFIKNYWWVLISILILLAFILHSYKKTRKGSYLFDCLVLKIPVIGKMMRKLLLSRFASTLAILLDSGVDLISALAIVGDVVGNQIFAEALLDARSQVREGITLAKPLSEHKLFPRMVVQMVKIGEEAGSLEKMLQKISAFYEREVEASVAGVISLIEPLLIIILAVIVGFIVISIAMPMFDMFQYF